MRLLIFSACAQDIFSKFLSKTEELLARYNMAYGKKKSEVLLYFEFAREDRKTIKNKITCSIRKATIPYSGNNRCART